MVTLFSPDRTPAYYVLDGVSRVRPLVRPNGGIQYVVEGMGLEA